MGFYMFPLDPKVKNIFIGSEAGLLKKRIPISIRARSNCKNIEIHHLDWQNNNGRSFKLGDNLISLKISNKVDKNIISTLLLHVTQIFEGVHLNIGVLGKRDKDEDHISIKLSDLEVQCVGDYNAHEYYLGRMDFGISHSDHRIDMRWINSRQREIGGKMLVALYKIAKDLEIKSIFFYPDNTLAKQFYYHMDFGNNDYEVDHRKANDWKVDVK